VDLDNVTAPGQREDAVDVRGAAQDEQPAGDVPSRMVALTMACTPELSMNSSSRRSSTTSRASS